MKKAPSTSSGICSKFNAQRPVIIVLTISVVIYLVYEIWTVESEKRPLIERNDALTKELAKVLLDLETKDRKLVILERKLTAVDTQVKESSKQLIDCKTSYNGAVQNADNLRVKSDQNEKKVQELQNLLDKKMELVKQLVDASGAPGERPKNSANVVNNTRSTIKARCHIWVGYVDTNSVNGIINREQNTLSGCQHHCIEVPDCVAIDFDNTAVPKPTCWVHTNAKDLDGSNTYQQFGTTQHRLNRDCLKNSA